MGRALEVWASDPAPGAHFYVGECVRAVKELGDFTRQKFIWVFDWNSEGVRPLLTTPSPCLVLEVYTAEPGWQEFAKEFRNYIGAVIYPDYCYEFVNWKLKTLLDLRVPLICADSIYSPLFDPVRRELAWESAPEPSVQLPPRSAVMGVPVSSELGNRATLTRVARLLEAEDKWLVFWGKGNVEADWVLPFAPNVLWLEDIYPSQFHYLVQQAEAVIVPYFDGLTFEVLTAWRTGKPVWAIDADQVALAKISGVPYCGG